MLLFLNFSFSGGILSFSSLFLFLGDCLVPSKYFSHLCRLPFYSFFPSFLFSLNLFFYRLPPPKKERRKKRKRKHIVDESRFSRIVLSVENQRRLIRFSLAFLRPLSRQFVFSLSTSQTTTNERQLR